MSEWVLSANYSKHMQPATVIDVGVNKGTPELYAAFPKAYLLLIEPNRENNKHIKEILTQYSGEHVMVAAGSHTGSATLNVETSRTGLSSFFKRTALTATGNVIEQREVPVRTLDELTGSRDLPRPFGLKIDTEGYELEVVRGATETLKNVDFIISETSTAGRFEGGYQSADLILELGRQGFVVVDILKTTGRFADVLFFRHGLVF